ncbi:SepM family pheromone-processing serine protease [Lacticaseibacillus hulanensis]|uniref:SepM family pheromone-processing serine protease n=1 Tax=Lacticaseibacillus hulanensis TaxID=2493111 RepID=UPI001F4E33D1|nr:SepM family pheromone-processing serine protease [Lacticaseibacillus hulanensis]
MTLKSKKTNSRLRRWLIALTAIVVVAALALWPTKYYVEVPGGADKLSKFVQVDGKRDQQSGSYRLMTVGIIGPASPLVLAWGKTQPFADFVSKSELMGDSSSAEYTELQIYYIKSAANAAVVSAMHAAKKPVTIQYKGIYVMSIMKNSHFGRDLHLGDTITAINGKHYAKSADYINAIKAHPAGTKVTITYVHKGHTYHATQPLVPLKGTSRAGLGISLTDHTVIKSQPKVKINAGAIGGPSAGLMFTLQVYDQVTGSNLRRGRTVAGTGTMDDAGNVGVIGGIDKKVYAAAKAGATIFFAPDVPATKQMRREDPTYVNNYVEAKRAAKKMGTKMKIVPVRNLADAIDYLQRN